MSAFNGASGTSANGEQGGTPSSCNTCKATFPSVERIKEHYRGDWHVFNSRRRANGLPPLSKEDFRIVGRKLRQAGSGSSSSASSSASLAPSSSASVCSIVSSQSRRISKHPQSTQVPSRDYEKGRKTETSGGESAEKKATPNDHTRVEEGIRQLGREIGLEEDRLESVVHLAMERGRLKANEETSDTPSKKTSSTKSKPVGEKGGEGVDNDDDDDEDGEEEDEEEEEEEEDEEEEEEEAKPQPIGPNISIFDDKEFATTDECVEYMSQKFGFFIPDAEYLTDKDGLLVYLGEKVKLGGLCLYCQKQLQPGWSCQNHMISKSHCKIAYEEDVDLDEFEDFYDFSSQYDDLPVGPDGEVVEATAEISPSTGELILPDGRIVGHRKYRIIYKQRYRPEETRPDVLAAQREQVLRLGGQFGGTKIKSTDLINMSDVEIMTILLKYHKAQRKGAIVEQRAMRRREFIDQRRQYRSLIDKARSTATTTAIIRDYHKTVM